MDDIKNIAIVGRGIIGSSWALVYARKGFRVRIWSRGEENDSATLKTVKAAYEALSGTGLEGDQDTLERISVHSDLGETVRTADFIQESVPEKIELKHQVLQAIETAATTNCIIGSSTSGIMPSQLATALRFPERFMVVHPLTPPHLLPITELCAAPQTSEATVSATTQLLRKIGQHPVQLKSEIYGFALNRILGAMMNECFALIRDGVLSADNVDPLLTEGFGLRWAMIGPLAAMDLNAPGGIGDYLRRYGGIYEVVSRDRGSSPVLNDELINRIADDLRRLYRVEDTAERIAKRDRGIAELRVARDGIHQRLWS